jgi:hypothetical protein
MVKLETILVFDIPALLTFLGIIVNAKIAKSTKGKVREIHKKVEEIESNGESNE